MKAELGIDQARLALKNWKSPDYIHPVACPHPSKRYSDFYKIYICRNCGKELE